METVKYTLQKFDYFFGEIKHHWLQSTLYKILTTVKWYLLSHDNTRQNHSRMTLSNAGPRVIEILSKQPSWCTSMAQSFLRTSSVWNLAATCLRWLRTTRLLNITSLRVFSDFWMACSSCPERRFRIRMSSSFSPSYNTHTDTFILPYVTFKVVVGAKADQIKPSGQWDFAFWFII